MGPWELLLDVVMLLGSCLVVGFLFARIGQNPIVGYLLAGMALGGPWAGQLIETSEELDTLAELGVSLLLFSIGLEFSWIRLRSMERSIWVVGIAQILVTTFIAAGIAVVLTGNARVSLAIGMMISLSSTAVVLRVLMERAEIDSRSGRTALAVLLVQDIAIIPFAIAFTFLVPGDAEGGVAGRLWQMLLSMAGLIVGLYIILTHVALRVLHSLSPARVRELLVILATTTGLASAWVSHEIGLSPAIGAFLAGMFLGGSPFATQIRADIASLRVLLLTLFFGTAGMVADPTWIGNNILLVLGVSLAVIVGKALIIWIILTIVQMPHPVGVGTGLRLAQVGEFSFVLAALGISLGVFDSETQNLIVSVAIVTLILAPLLIVHAPKLGIWVGMKLGSTFDTQDVLEQIEREPCDTIVIGYGPAGLRAAKALEHSGRRVLVIEMNTSGAARARRHGFDAIVGDATQVDVLEHAHIEQAQTVLITIPSRSTALTIMAHVRRLAPTSHIIVRARYLQHVGDFVRAGANLVLDDETQVGDALAKRLSESENVAPEGE
ncbi:MAG: cation:proton antiporter [Phycisphaerales bacterium JB043]